MKKIFNVMVLGSALAGLMSLSACNTTKGFGEDVSSGGKKVEKAAVKHGATPDSSQSTTQ